MNKRRWEILKSKRDFERGVKRRRRAFNLHKHHDKGQPIKESPKKEIHKKRIKRDFLRESFSLVKRIFGRQKRGM